MISVIILNFNKPMETIRCLESLYESSFKDFSVILVDNGSTDGSVEKIKKEFPKLKIIETGENLGFSGGVNVGIKKNEAEYILLLNNDTVVDKNLLKNLLEGFKWKKNIGIVGPKIYYLNSDKIWFAGGVIDKVNFTGGHIGVKEIDHGQYDQPKIVDFISGCCLMIKTDLVKKIGLFDERYFFYYDDVEWAIRLKKTGYKCLYYPKAIVRHNDSLTIGNDSPAKHYYLSRGQLLFIEKNTGLNQKLIFLPRLIKKIIILLWCYIIKKNKSAHYELLGIRDYFLKRWGKLQCHSRLDRESI